MIGVAAAALACCAQAFALTSASIPVSARIERPGGIEIINPLVLPTVNAANVARGGSGQTVSGSSRAVSVGTPVVGNATLTIRGQAGDAVSMAVPESFTVVRNGGTEALTVRTNTNTELGVSNGGVVLGGVMGGNSMSVNVGGALSLASADNVEPGAYEGLLVVVVQYN
jgi:hypothetical protein